MSKIFITGVTGFIGGAVLQHIVAAYPSAKVTALVRNSEKASKVTAAFPGVATVIGDLDSEALEAQSEIADIVINAADCDHEGSVNAIIRGLEKRGGGYLIHTSGMGLLFDEPNGSVLSEKVWDDIEDLEELSSFPDAALHRNTEKLVLAAPPSVHTAIVSPGKVYGRGTGPDRIFTIPFFANIVLSLGHGLKIGTGVSRMGLVHIDDLARLYVLLVGEALKPNGGAAQWDAHGYYFAVADDEVSVAEHISVTTDALAAVGRIKSNKVETLTLEKARELHPFFPIIFGANARARASRAKALGWKVPERKILEIMGETLREEYGPTATLE